jgi:ketosteroid isomerase-like protein
MPSDHPNAQLLLRAFQAILDGNVDEFWSTQSDNASALVVGTRDMAGDFVGSDRTWIPCQTYLRLSGMLSHPTARKRIAVRDVLATDDQAVLLYETTSDESGRILPGVVTCRIRDGRIESIEHFDSLTQYGGLRALQSPPQ